MEKKKKKQPYPIIPTIPFHSIPNIYKNHPQNKPTIHTSIHNLPNSNNLISPLMAAAPTPRRAYYAAGAGPNYRFLLPSDHQIINDDNSVIFELDESDIWNDSQPRSGSPDYSTSREFSSSPAIGKRAPTASLPVNVPDWSKILKQEYHRRNMEDYEYYEEEEVGDRIPPHVFVARGRMASLSVQEGIGRTLKGRDLSRLRNAIWQKTGFQD